MRPKHTVKPVELDLTLDEIKSLDRDKVKKVVKELQRGIVDA